MSDTKFTPWPWEPVQHSWGEAGVYGSNTRIAGLDVRFEATEETEAEWTSKMMANAHMIAAAPDLYAALENVMREFGPGTMSEAAFIGACAALAKARGGQP